MLERYGAAEAKTRALWARTRVICRTRRARIESFVPAIHGEPRIQDKKVAASATHSDPSRVRGAAFPYVHDGPFGSGGRDDSGRTPPQRMGANSCARTPKAGSSTSPFTNYTFPSFFLFGNHSMISS
jgi:hypothetical protein